MQSGSKLVLGIFGLAVAAGVLSWWYRYEAAHRSTTFWGPHFAELIAQPSEVTAFGLKEISPTQSSDESFPILSKPYYPSGRKNVTAAPGMVHLRNAILTDRNYQWEREVATDAWRWALQFSEAGRSATILFTEDFAILGRLNQRADEVRVVDCRPMAETLREYFKSSGIFAINPPKSPASNAAE